MPVSVLFLFSICLVSFALLDSSRLVFCFVFFVLSYISPFLFSFRFPLLLDWLAFPPISFSLSKHSL